MYKVLYDKPESTPSLEHDLSTIQANMDECQAMEDLMYLWEEGHANEDVPWCFSPPGVSSAGASFPPTLVLQTQI